MSRPLVSRIDHFVLTVANVEATCAFYGKALGMETVTFSGGRKGLAFGGQKINLHQHGAEFVPHARTIAPGSGDFCLTSEVSLDEIIEHLKTVGVEIEEGPVPKTGARSKLRSVYFRDPDGNLVEVSNEVD